MCQEEEEENSQTLRITVIQGLEEYTKKSDERLYTSVRSSHIERNNLWTRAERGWLQQQGEKE